MISAILVSSHPPHTDTAGADGGVHFDRPGAMRLRAATKITVTLDQRYGSLMTGTGGR